MSSGFHDAAVRVRVPATSANLGSGFDALGLALSLHDDVVGRVCDAGLSVAVTGEGADLAGDETHLVVRAMRATFDRLGGQPAGIELSCTNRIPHSRGLGSSAAAIVAGVVLARALAAHGAEELSDDAALALAAELEGHPDNVAACLLGGLTIAWRDPQARAARVEPHPDIRPLAFIPPFTSTTAEVRGLLPDSVPHADAAFAAGRSALLVAALTGAPGALIAATEDRLHQSYRAAAMPSAAELIKRLRAAGHAAVLSGAGPTVLVLAKRANGANGDNEVETASVLAPPDWRFEFLAVDVHGAQVLPAAG